MRSERLETVPTLVFDMGKAGDLVETMNPMLNRHCGPPSHEAAAVHAMEGVLWVNCKRQRLVEISGHLTHPVKFGGGLLGHLDGGWDIFM